MPEQYLAMKKKMMAEGMSEKEAETHAAKMYNAKHPDNPVGRYYEAKMKKKKHPYSVAAEK